MSLKIINQAFYGQSNPLEKESSTIVNDRQIEILIYKDLTITVKDIRANTKHLFSKAGFSLVIESEWGFTTNPDEFWRLQIVANILVYVGREVVGRDDVIQAHDIAKSIGGEIRVLVVVSDDISDSGLIEIGALRAEKIYVIHIKHSLIQNAINKGEEKKLLSQELRNAFGKKMDLYGMHKLPVFDNLNFFGREQMIERINSILERSPVAIFGLRKIGKSSLLKYIQNNSNYPIAYIDMQTGARSAIECFNIIIQRLSKEINKRYGLDIASSIPKDASFIDQVVEMADYLKKHSSESRLGLLIDEIEMILPSNEKPGSLENYLLFARSLRGLIQEGIPLNLITVGVDPRICRGNEFNGEQNPFYQFFSEEYLGTLSPDFCGLMVRTIGKNMGLVYTDDALEFIYNCTGGHPYLTRQLCSINYMEILGDTATKVERKHLEEAANRFVSIPQTSELLGDSNGIWYEITDQKKWHSDQIEETKIILNILSKQNNLSEQQLLRNCKHERSGRDCIDRLEKFSVLETIDGKISIKINLFLEWIKKYVV
jgi:hypothetical protein